ncbi:uncharacterized protein LOC131949828 isoform X1 [Physella acuta]|uniref:uncharacterized protein LOC131949828 isoform X1 n=1 Tax=Physella acuta TaxID=109671 RepID=UPI0027DCE0D5|nr:uncharacterized protein LOC131949828 isoform X1 [Physella acuta]XP_059167808.1 uncharacterized protein LOC131949828 isoform X1 [Physella acuta]XP_059167809.1 uncharacterized protein LOC131949828 isoform X1 [Physella acuta]XP_059167810.1 uncharacterized protein LOC131949828 isoform X1 [Physella acuta]XP_059167811.1 uncharacterized protein LOC131949828 isoform X1 [Physella acuta]XP_059167812.1 uncharacterized protein LOC131949828 isoform X1 [Physella acuta]
MALDWDDWTSAENIQTLIASHLRHQYWTFKKTDDVENILKDQLTFLFCSNSRCKYTDNEGNMFNIIAQKCSVYIKMDLCISIIYVCVKTMPVPPNNILVPLIRLKYHSDKGVKNIHFIDPTGRVYNTWDDFRNDNIFKGYEICYPRTGKYTDDIECEIKKWEQDLNYTHYDKLLKVEFVLKYVDPLVEEGIEIIGEPADVVEVIKMSRSDIKNLNLDGFKLKFIALIYRYRIDSRFVIKIIHRLKEQCNNDDKDIFNALLDGFINVTGQKRENLGNAYFIINIGRIWQQSDSLKDIKLTTNKNMLQLVFTSDGKMKTKYRNINKKDALFTFTFDAKAFVQIEEEFKDLKKDYLIHKYRWISDETIFFKIREICALLKCPSIFLFTLNGKPIFNNIKNRGIQNIHTNSTRYVSDINKPLLEDYLNIGIEVASLIDCQDVHDFCAVYEFFVIYVKKNFFKNVLEFLLNKNKKHDLIKEIKDAMEKCAPEMKGNIKFGQLSAATHFFKHSKDVDCFNTEKKYFSLATEMTSRTDVPFHWSQDGTEKRYTFFKDLKDSKEKKLIAVKCIPENGAATIATLHMEKKGP